MSHVCRICGNSENNRVHRAREMMFGTRDEFDYIECAACGTLQISEIPDLEKYYPENYLAFDSKVIMGETFAKRLAARFSGQYLLTGKGVLGRSILSRKPWIADHYPISMRGFPLGIDFNSRILDFGSGTGQLLQSLHYFGFKDLTGADAFIRSDIAFPTGVKTFKRDLRELDPPFDLVMLHHSLEHLPNPAEALARLPAFGPGNYALVRIPVAAFAWEKYGVNWVQMDPPRHLFLFSEKAMRKIAKEAGFEVDAVIYDSSEFQFWGSEQYASDIPLVGSGHYKGFFPSINFSDEQMSDWRTQATRLNAENRGDQACFYLRKI